MTAVLFVLRAAILILLWGFVVAAIVAVRHDVFGTSRRARPASAPPAPAGRPAAAPPAKRQRQRQRSAPRQLVVVEGALAGHTVPLGNAPIVIGRADDSTLVLSDDYVSTRHARLLPRDGGWVVEDLGSTNGTYVARERVTRPTPVAPGTPIRVGKTVMELRR